ncbi:MAG: hypothetical protein NTX15_05560 [Candidatus Kapabacteria bacterium]|nr:hypothetical protein [Candidatus Kapabacteria bacterium]
MSRIVGTFYNAVALPAMAMWLRAASLVNRKMRQRGHEEPLAIQRALLLNKSTTRVLFHAASMGELEQCVPIMHSLTKLHPRVELFVSSTSPSGHAHAQSLDEVRCAVYQPIDTKRNVRKYLDVVKPDAIVIDRYDVWPNFIAEAHRREISIHLVNATMPSAALNRFLRIWVRGFYRLLTTITAVDARDQEYLSELTGLVVDTLPDTRIDRVIERIGAPSELILQLKRDMLITVIVGSSWPADEDLIFKAISSINDPQLRLIVAPHEPTEAAVSRIEEHLSITRLSNATQETREHIVVDSVGSLLSLYAIADAAFVGGGFGSGVHSVTEPAVHGIPIASGPHTERSRDARSLEAANVLHKVASIDDAITWLRTIVLDPQRRTEVGERARAFFRNRSGSSELYAHTIASSLNEQPRSSE